MGLFNNLFSRKKTAEEEKINEAEGKLDDFAKKVEEETRKMDEYIDNTNARMNSFYQNAPGEKSARNMASDMAKKLAKEMEERTSKKRDFKESLKPNFLDKKFFEEGNVPINNILRHIGISPELAENSIVQNSILNELDKKGILAQKEDRINELVNGTSNLLTIINPNNIELKITDNDEMNYKKIFKIGKNKELTSEKFIKANFYSNDSDIIHITNQYNEKGLLMETESKFENSKRGVYYHKTKVRDKIDPFIIHEFDYKNETPNEKIYITNEEGVLNLDGPDKKIQTGDITDIREEQKNQTSEKIKLIMENPKYSKLLNTYENLKYSELTSGVEL